MRMQIGCLGLLLVFAPGSLLAQRVDLRSGVPEDVFLVVHAKHNPERDVRNEHLAEVWQTVQETKIIDKVLKLITDSVSAQQLDQAKSVMEELQTAVEPLDLTAIAKMEDGIYTQRMRGFANQQLALLRLGDAADGWEEGLTNLMRLVDKYSDGSVPVRVSQYQGATLTALAVPAEAQMTPVVARLGGILLLSNSEDFLKQSLDMLHSDDAPSKFDDPRLVSALAKLPPAEDVTVFYDGKLQFDQMRNIGQSIRQLAGDNREAQRIADVMETIFNELSIVDFEATVEYTEGDQNHTQTYGRLLPDVEQKMLYRAIAAGQPIEDWQSWVPQDAMAYSIQSGVNLHTIYDWSVNFIQEKFPESQDAFAQFEAVQQQLQVDLDQDILQSFSGACVSITLPPAQASMLGSPDSVMALRCENPEKIGELIHRGFEALQSHPVAKAQQLRLVECPQVPDFEQVSSVLGTAFGLTPTFGFADGWLLIGSNGQAIQRVLAVRSGEAKSIVESEPFLALAPLIEDPVYAVSYNNLGESIRNGAKMLGQVGAVAQIAIGIAGMQPDAAELKPVQDFMALLPDVAKIVAKFDFLEEQLSVSQALSDEPGAYTRSTVIKVRSPSKPEPAAETTPASE